MCDERRDQVWCVASASRRVLRNVGVAAANRLLLSLSVCWRHFTGGTGLSLLTSEPRLMMVRETT